MLHSIQIVSCTHARTGAMRRRVSMRKRGGLSDGDYYSAGWG